MPPYVPVPIRFWSKVNIPPDRNRNDCWEWIGSLDPKGYGSFGIQGRTRKAHRVAYELHHATEIPSGMHVCHSCDNPKCCNPSHLWLGTNADNHRDMAKKGRAGIRRGEDNVSHKFTDGQIEQVFALRAEGLKQREIAERLQISRGYISSILRGRWRRRD